MGGDESIASMTAAQPPRGSTKPAKSRNKAAAPRNAGKRGSLTRDDILKAALAIVDHDGLDALTMRAVADRLNVYPNALYWHIGSRSALVGAVSTKVFDEIHLPDQDEVSWQDWIRAMARECRTAMHRHPNLARVIGAELVPTTRAMPFVERVLAVLSGAGFEDTRLPAAFNCVIEFAIGWPTLELSAESPIEEGSWKTAFADELDGLDPGTFPVLTRALPSMRNAAFMVRWDSGTSAPLDESHTFALEVLLAGLTAQLAKT
jgi:AcrR family transcriptional regulator